jgi:hypothetical protein
VCSSRRKHCSSPEDESSLLSKHCNVHFMLGDNGKSSNRYQQYFTCYTIVNELYGTIQENLDVILNGVYHDGVLKRSDYNKF